REGDARFLGDRHLSHDGRRKSARDPLRECRTAAGEPCPRRWLSQTARGLQHPALPQPIDLAGARRGRARRGREVCQGPQRVRPSRSRFPGMRWKIAEMYRDIEAARSILYRACATADPFPDPLLAAAAKVTVNEMALRVTSDAI